MKNLELKHWKVILQEKSGRILTPSLIGHYTREDVIDFFGLENEDVIWFKIEEKEKK